MALKTWKPLILLGLIIPITFFSCKKSTLATLLNQGTNKTSVMDTLHFKGTMSGSNATPPNNSPAAGTVNAYYNTQTKIMTYTLTWSNLTNAPFAMHFHEGPIGVSGQVLFGIPDFPSQVTDSVSGTTSAWTVFEDSALMVGDVYANIHTSTYPAGEIRGQLVKQ